MVVFFLCPFSYFFGVFIKILNLIVLPTEKYNTHFLTFCPSPPSIRLTFAALVFGALFFTYSASGTCLPFQLIEVAQSIYG